MKRINNVRYASQSVRFILACLVIGLAASGLSAQDEGERLLTRDGDIEIFRDEDGRVKIRREGAEEDDWLAIVDPDAENHFMIVRGGEAPIDVRVPRLREFYFDTDVDWDGPMREALVLSRGAGDLAEEIRTQIHAEVAPLTWLHETSELRQEIMKMEEESRRLAREARDATDAERTELEAELDQVLAEIFDAKLESRKERLEKLEQQADELRGEIDQRQARRSDIVAKRKQALLGQSDPLRW